MREARPDGFNNPQCIIKCPLIYPTSHNTLFDRITSGRIVTGKIWTRRSQMAISSRKLLNNAVDEWMNRKNLKIQTIPFFPTWQAKLAYCIRGGLIIACATVFILLPGPVEVLNLRASTLIPVFALIATGRHFGDSIRIFVDSVISLILTCAISTPIIVVLDTLLKSQNPRIIAALFALGIVATIVFSADPTVISVRNQRSVVVLCTVLLLTWSLDAISPVALAPFHVGLSNMVGAVFGLIVTFIPLPFFPSAHTESRDQLLLAVRCLRIRVAALVLLFVRNSPNARIAKVNVKPDGQVSYTVGSKLHLFVSDDNDTIRKSKSVSISRPTSATVPQDSRPVLNQPEDIPDNMRTRPEASFTSNWSPSSHRSEQSRMFQRRNQLGSPVKGVTSDVNPKFNQNRPEQKQEGGPSLEDAIYLEDDHDSTNVPLLRADLEDLHTATMPILSQLQVAASNADWEFINLFHWFATQCGYHVTSHWALTHVRLKQWLRVIQMFQHLMGVLAGAERAAKAYSYQHHFLAYIRDPLCQLVHSVCDYLLLAVDVATSVHAPTPEKKLKVLAARREIEDNTTLFFNAYTLARKMTVYLAPIQIDQATVRVDRSVSQNSSEPSMTAMKMTPVMASIPMAVKTDPESESPPARRGILLRYSPTLRVGVPPPPLPSEMALPPSLFQYDSIGDNAETVMTISQQLESPTIATMSSITPRTIASESLDISRRGEEIGNNSNESDRQETNSHPHSPAPKADTQIPMFGTPPAHPNTVHGKSRSVVSHSDTGPGFPSPLDAISTQPSIRSRRGTISTQNWPDIDDMIDQKGGVTNLLPSRPLVNDYRNNPNRYLTRSMNNGSDIGIGSQMSFSHKDEGHGYVYSDETVESALWKRSAYDLFSENAFLFFILRVTKLTMSVDPFYIPPPPKHAWHEFNIIRLFLNNVKSYIVALCWKRTQPNLKMGIKTAVTMIIAAAISVYFRKELGPNTYFWSSVAIGFLAGTTDGGLLRASILRVAGTLLGSMTGYFIIIISHTRLSVVVPLISLFTAVMQFPRTNPVTGYWAFVAAFTACIVVLAVGPNTWDHTVVPDQVSTVAMNRIKQNVLGLACSVVVGTMIFPTSARTLVKKKVCHAMNTVSAMVKDSLHMFSAVASANEVPGSSGRGEVLLTTPITVESVHKSIQPLPTIESIMTQLPTLLDEASYEPTLTLPDFKPQLSRYNEFLTALASCTRAVRIIHQCTVALHRPQQVRDGSIVFGRDEHGIPPPQIPANFTHGIRGVSMFFVRLHGSWEDLSSAILETLRLTCVVFSGPRKKSFRNVSYAMLNRLFPCMAIGKTSATMSQALRELPYAIDRLIDALHDYVLTFEDVLQDTIQQNITQIVHSPSEKPKSDLGTIASLTALEELTRRSSSRVQTSNAIKEIETPIYPGHISIDMINTSKRTAPGRDGVGHIELRDDTIRKLSESVRRLRSPQLNAFRVLPISSVAAICFHTSGFALASLVDSVIVLARAARRITRADDEEWFMG